MMQSRTIRLGSAADLIRRKLELFGPLLPEDRFALENAGISIRQVSSGRDLLRLREEAGASAMLLGGWAYSYKMLASGGRQIMSLQVPGDVIDPQAVLGGAANHDVVALGDVTIGVISAATVADWMQSHPELVRRLWLNGVVHLAVAQEWVVNVGRRTALQRVAHLLCELLTRLAAVGLAAGRSCRVPLTQVHLADATGLSTVHVNRTLQQLRRAGLIEFRGSGFSALDWAALRELAGFDPAYLGFGHGQAIGRERWLHQGGRLELPAGAAQPPL